MSSSSVKIAFAFHSHLLDKWTIETMWARVSDEESGHYELDSIPFYATGVACGDIVRAQYSEEEDRLKFIDVVKSSGHSTIQVIIVDANADNEKLRERFHQLGCDSELLSDKYFVLDVPPKVDYSIVRKELKGLQSDGVLDYAEACLSSTHYYE